MVSIDRIKKEAFDFNDGELVSDKLERSAFVCGAKWMQSKFLDDLWHNADEKPADDKLILYVTECRTGSITALYLLGAGWDEVCEALNISKWAYMDDLMPQKEGGFND